MRVIAHPSLALLEEKIGYYEGSKVTGNIAEALYAKIDERVKKRVDAWIVSTSYEHLVSQSL